MENETKFKDKTQCPHCKATVFCVFRTKMTEGVYVPSTKQYTGIIESRVCYICPVCREKIGGLEAVHDMFRKGV